MKISRIVVGFSCALLFAGGCATYIPIKVLEPAKLDIPPFHKVAVLDFTFTGQWHFWFDNDRPQTLRDVAVKVLVDQLGLDKRERPDPRRAFPGSEVSAALVAALVRNGHYQVIERTAIERTFAQRRMAMGENIDFAQVAQVGAALGVDAVILGSGEYTVSDNEEPTEVREIERKKVAGEGGKSREVEDTIVRKEFRAVREVEAEVSYRVVDIKTGQVVAAHSNKTSRAAQSQKRREEEAFQTLPEWRPALSGAIDELVERTVRQIAPHYICQNRKIEGGKSSRMKSALDYAKRGMMDDAKGLWEQVAHDESLASAPDRVNALYNLAVYAEVAGDLDKAEEYYNTCYKLSGKTAYLDRCAEIQTRKARLKAQMVQ
jgi:hypothetical protein